MGRHILCTVTVPATNHHGADQTGDAAIDVHHRATSKIKDSVGGEKATAPYPVGDRSIDDHHPKA